jgi:glutamate-1-semialdehyde 2,1-aminomutase
LAEWIDPSICCSHGATLLGHNHPAIRSAIESALSRGAACSYENETHAELAELLCDTVPCLERVRFTGSGTEATLHVLRLARACTGRTKILKFEGNFHGYHDQVMFAIGHPADRLGTLHPGSAGMPPSLGDHLVMVPYNRPDLLEDAFQKHGHEIAAVIGELVYYNAGCILPTREFLDAMRSLTTKHGALLIFDEVLSAFRMCPGGAQSYLGVTPDLCTLGKAVGGSQPLSVFGGRADLMERLMPTGDCQHSGTYNGHPVAVAAALAAVKEYRKPGFYDHIDAVAKTLLDGMNASFSKHGIDAQARGLGARFGVYFGVPGVPEGYADVVRHHRPLMLRFIKEAIARGVYFHDYGGAACHHGFCHAMGLDDSTEALRRLDEAIRTMAG